MIAMRMRDRRSALEIDPSPQIGRRLSCSRGKARAAFLFLGALGLLLAGPSAPGLAQDASLAGRPGLAGAEEKPAALATCEDLRASLAGFRPLNTRVDLWVTGALTLVRTDGVLWYLAVCSSPGIRVMCVTYSDNGMKLGERVTLRGAYERQDERHILLDPCLASRS